MLENENIIRLGTFLGVLLLMFCWEALAPRRMPMANKWTRRINNLLLITVATLFVRLCLHLLVTLKIADLAANRSWGLFNQLAWDPIIEGLLAIIFLDLVIYFQHVMFHKVPLLWQMHQVHHSDLDFDTTTGIRFHPFEIIISLLIKSVAVLIIGAPVMAVLIFEILLNTAPLFNHANIRLPESVDRWLRLIIVTPDMHRVHHSIYRFETDSNYCFSLPWWDRIFGTYRAQPRDGHSNMRIGLDYIQASDTTYLNSLLLQPFKARPIKKTSR